jgi:sarcosine oxidase subunit beta
MSKPSVCIIGAGAVGLATAVHLVRRGVDDVVVLEAEHPAAHSSGLSVGIIETQYVKPLDIELRVRAMRFFSELERDHGLHVLRNGYLRLAHNAQQVAAFEQAVSTQHELGVPDAAFLDRNAVAELIPEMRCDDIEGGLWGPSDGFIDGHLYCGLMAEMVSEAGGRVLTGHKLLEADRDAGGRHLLTTSRGSFTADFVVNAAGGWASRVADMLGGSMPVVPQRHQAVMVHFQPPLDYTMPSVMDYTPHSGEFGLYFRHERPGQLVAGLHTEEALHDTVDPDAYPRSADADYIEGVAEKLLGRLPGLSHSGIGHGWAGIYPISPDGVPQVGPNPGCDTVISAGGAGGSGIQLSPVLGELAADWITEGAPRCVADGAELLPGRDDLAAAATEQGGR